MGLRVLHFIQAVSIKFSHTETSEMGYRTDFEILLKGIFESINVKRIDHDARAKQGNKPDFVVLKDDIPILYIEAKDIGVSFEVKWCFFGVSVGSYEDKMGRLSDICVDLDDACADLDNVIASMTWRKNCLQLVKHLYISVFL